MQNTINNDHQNLNISLNSQFDYKLFKQESDIQIFEIFFRLSKNFRKFSPGRCRKLS